MEFDFAWHTHAYKFRKKSSLFSFDSLMLIGLPCFPGNVGNKTLIKIPLLESELRLVLFN